MYSLDLFFGGGDFSLNVWDIGYGTCLRGLLEVLSCFLPLALLVRRPSGLKE